jgi:hypothetical protein
VFIQKKWKPKNTILQFENMFFIKKQKSNKPLY